MPSRRKQQQEATRDDSANENEDSVVDPSRDSTAEPDGFASDSSEEGRPSRNTVGNVPLNWYDHEEHIGYDRAGGKITKGKRKSHLDSLLARNDDPQFWRTIHDELNDEDIQLSKEELQMLQRIRQGQFPHVEVNPFEPETDYFTRDPQIHPIKAAPRPKAGFIPSKSEAKQVVRLVRAIRRGWIKLHQEAKPEDDPPYLMWADDGQVSEKTLSGLSYIAPPKPALPGHEESYHPPPEYLPSEEEKAASLAAAEEAGEPPALLPQSYDSLRLVPSYAAYINERFERCLDLYLCPRTRRRRPFIKDPTSLIPQLPKPQDLRPFPHKLLLRFLGHKGSVFCIAADPTGQWLASGGADSTLRIWDASTGRCTRTWKLEEAVRSVAWCPSLRILSAAAGRSVYLLPSGVGTEEQDAAAEAALQLPEEGKGLCEWRRHGEAGLQLLHQHDVARICWHARGDYFCSLCPVGNTKAVLVHQLSKRVSQTPFRKNKGRLVDCAFHPSKPFLFLASQHQVRVYNLAKQELAKKLLGGSGAIMSMAVHSSGDHVLLGSQDHRVSWYDLDLSTKPYRTMQYHKDEVAAVAFHASYPLFASASADGSVHVFHGQVFQDLMTNPLIVPVKILHGHTITKSLGALATSFHPHQPWVFTAGADGAICLFGD